MIMGIGSLISELRELRFSMQDQYQTQAEAISGSLLTGSGPCCMAGRDQRASPVCHALGDTGLEGRGPTFVPPPSVGIICWVLATCTAQQCGQDCRPTLSLQRSPNPRRPHPTTEDTWDGPEWTTMDQNGPEWTKMVHGHGYDGQRP